MCFGTSLEETCLLTKRQPVQRRHDLDTGVNTEQENLSIDDKGKKQAFKSVRMNTDAIDRGGAARSSVEASVMGVERRGSVI